jgi:16S rRNA (cytidine1402-2'-O)-methyltransferase
VDPVERRVMLIVGGVDIGNRRDIGSRMIDAIRFADVIVAENISNFQTLCNSLGIDTMAILVEYYAPMDPLKELDIVTDIVDYLANDKRVLLLTDDGMPGIADPGGRLIKLAHKMSYKVTVIPGPSIVSTLPAVLGVDSRRFTFEDELPSDRHERLRMLQKLRSEDRGFLFIVKNRRDENYNFKNILADIDIVFDPHTQIGLGVNLTMPNEMILLSTVSELLNSLEHYTFTQQDFISVYIGE